YLTQTTLAVDDTAEVVEALRQRFPAMVGPRLDDICYASQNRQLAVKALAARSDLVLIVGSANSSNANRLVEVAREAGAPAWLVGSGRMSDGRVRSQSSGLPGSLRREDRCGDRPCARGRGRGPLAAGGHQLSLRLGRRRLRPVACGRTSCWR